VGIVLVPLAAQAAGGGRTAWAGFAALAAATAGWSFTALPARQQGQRSQLPDAITRLADTPPRPLHLGLAASLAGGASSPMWIFWRDVQERSELSATLHPASTLVFAGIGVLAYLPLAGSVHRPDPKRVFNGAMLFLGGASAAFGATTSGWAALTAAAVFGGTYAVGCGALLRWGATQSATSAHGIRFALLFLFVGHAVGAAVAGEVLAVTAPANAFVGAGVVAGLASTLGLLGHLARRAVWRGRVALAWIMGRPHP
jgi:hypothetical protein